MAISYRTRGIVLKEVDRGETDKIFIVFTKDFGKLEILGKAIRKIKSKLRGGIGLFYLSEIEFIQGKKYKTLTDTSLIDSFKNLRKSLKRLRVAFKINEILDKLLRGEEKDERIWRLLKGTFYKLNDSSFSNFIILYYYFFWILISLLGYKPELNSCVVCRKRLAPENLYLSSEDGGIICQECFEKNKKGKEIDPDTIKILRILLKRDLSTIKKLKIKEEHFKSLKDISDYFFQSLQFS